MKLILGMGLTGLSVARFFKNQQVSCQIADSRQSPPLLETFITEGLAQGCQLGSWRENLLEGVEEIIVSPGIAMSETIIVWAKAKDIPLIGDIELFSHYANAPIIGISGSNGKSTVTQLVGEMGIAEGKNTAICGNIGTPVMDALSDDVDLYIVELSSYQLDYINSLDLLAGLVLNITPDHLDRYVNFEAYISSKISLYPYCQNRVINLDESVTSDIVWDSCFGLEDHNQECEYRVEVDQGVTTFFNKDDALFNSENLKIVGKHNMSNILAALTLGHLAGLSNRAMTQAVVNFKGLPHRLEWVVNKDGVDFFNDSKSTNANSTITAINALSDHYPTLVLIAGGIAKKEDYSAMFDLIGDKTEAVVLIGEAAEGFASNITNCVVEIAQSMEQALLIAKCYTASGAVLLSPACASFDMYEDFNARGDDFKRLLAL
jgi:UDP-N-acetylmuramoylalanine--D-glutamate ligase